MSGAGTTPDSGTGPALKLTNGIKRYSYRMLYIKRNVIERHRTLYIIESYANWLCRMAGAATSHEVGLPGEGGEWGLAL